ncbi:MAG: response regulator [Nitrospinae bacterium]|nr:response regulator [Nitrospinota bacterium]
MSMIAETGGTVREEVLREQVRLAIGQIPMMQGASYIVALALAIVYWHSAVPALAIVWLGLVTAIALSRVALYFRFRPVAKDETLDGRYWHDIYLRLTVISGFVWGTSAFLLYPAGDTASQSFLILIMTALASATVVSHTSVRLAPAAWDIPLLVAYSARSLWEGGIYGYAVGILLPLYCAALVMYSFRIHGMMAASIERRFENMELLEEVRQATRLKDKFVSLVSHDLRGPIAGLKSGAEYIKEILDNDPASPHARSLTVSISESAGSLLTLLDQLLDISRLQSGKITPIKRIVHPRQIADEKIMLFAQAAEKKVLTIRNDLPPAMCLIADPALYGQVISNLMGNAVKFCNAGGQVRLFAPDGSINTVAIEDTGVGIKPEVLPDLFKPEVKTTTFGTAGEIGTGLGLPYSLEIMRAHGGDIRVESSLGAGSTFYVSLPAAAVTFLIVDDQEAHRRMMMQIIRSSFPAEFLEAEDGYEALSVLREMTPDLIITDLNMPGMDGIAFLEKMRELPGLSSVPIVVATSLDGMPGNEARESARDLGAAAFVRKPVVAQEFTGTIRTVLEKGR